MSAGILAVSASVPTPGTATDNVVAGYITGEAVALSVTPAGTSYTWGQAIPAGSTPKRSGLPSTGGATQSFTPDVAGVYVITCTVDGTAYTLRMSVTATTAVTATGATRYLPVTDASVTAPPVGCVVYMSSSTTPPKLSVKFPDNSIQRLTT